jgi:hypothetical protein
VACGDSIDNDGDGLRDCMDSDCVGAGTENCTDGIDNNCNAQIDCADPACIGGTPETSCTDGLDSNCNGLIDCADATCTGNGSCAALTIGKACSVGTQCASGVCRTEGASGWPSGSCVTGTNSCWLDAGVSAGCPSGSACTGDEFGRFCRQQCSGNGATTCRPGYACHANPDFDWNDGPRTCTPLCNSDADCSRISGIANYGCNPWSKRCELKDRGLGKTGAACSNNSQCETGFCLGERGGYCSGICRKTTLACPSDSVCGGDGTNDQTGRCFDLCASQTECRSGYTCQPPPYGGTSTNVCYCSRNSEDCNQSSDCCGTALPGFPACFLGSCATF